MTSNAPVCGKLVSSCLVIEKSESCATNTTNFCVNRSVCRDDRVSEKSDQCCACSEHSCDREENFSVCGTCCVNLSSDELSVRHKASNEARLSLDQSIQRKSEKCPFACPCAPISACYNTIEIEDPIVDELLRHLPRKRYTDEVMGHWEMMLHCERVAFPKVVSNLPLPSREARFYWHLYSIAAKNSPLYQKQLNQALSITLAKLTHSGVWKKEITLWEQLIRLKTLDPLGRKNTVSYLERIIFKQTRLETICLEGLSLTPSEGVRLLLALYNSRKTMRYVYCWRAFEKMVGFAVDTNPRNKSRIYTEKRIHKCDWFRAIGCLEFLTTLSVNYAYIASPTGDLIVNLAKKLGAHWQWLQILCLEEEIIQNTNHGFSANKTMIPDNAWAAVHFWAPALKVQYAIIGIPQYDIHKKFFTKCTQIHTFALSTSIDMRFRQPWYLDCTIKTLCSWYSHSLVYLCLQLWHNRQNLDEQLRVLFICLPRLKIFEYIGEIRTLKTLCAMCCQIRSGHCGVCRVNMQLQDVVHDDFNKDKWIKSVQCLMVCFKCDFDKMGVKFEVDFYCC